MIAPSPTPQASAIDWPQLDLMLPNRATVLRILTRLVALHQNTPAELSEAFANSDWCKVKDIAHKMRGTASLLAAAQVHSSAQAVENNIGETGYASVDAVFLLKTAILDLLNEAQQAMNNAAA